MASHQKSDPGLDEDSQPHEWRKVLDDPEVTSRLMRALEGVVPDALKRSLVSGLGSVLLSEDGLRSLLLDKNLPKEAVGLLVGQADVMRREILRIVSREIRIFLENMDFGGEIAKILTALSFEIKMEVRFVANDQAVRPKTRSRVKVKRVRDGKEIDLGEDDLEAEPLSEGDEERDAEEPTTSAPAPPHVGQPPKKRRWALRRRHSAPDDEGEDGF